MPHGLRDTESAPSLTETTGCEADPTDDTTEAQ